MNTSPELKNKRPLSPHLQVYKPQMTSVLSITHRATGVALVAGTLMVAWWLIAAATGEEAYNIAREFAVTKVGTLMIFGWSVALFYHLSNGIRHLFWDLGYLFKIKNAYRAGFLVLLSTAILTGSTWYCAHKFASQDNPIVTETLAQNEIQDTMERAR